MHSDPWIVSFDSEPGDDVVKGTLEPRSPGGEECLRNTLSGTRVVMMNGHKLRLKSRTKDGYKFTGPAEMQAKTAAPKVAKKKTVAPKAPVAPREEGRDDV